MPEFSVRVSGDQFGFSAAHFITLADGQQESLHGHNYRATAEVSGPLDAACCVIDFIALGDLLKSILHELDHRVLLPAMHAVIAVADARDEVEVKLAQRRWVFPRSDCRLLPIANTTAEMLAEFIGQRLRDAIESQTGQRPGRLRIELQESPGYTAICEV